MPETTIPTYAGDGARLRNLPLATIEHLLSINEVSVRYDRKGNIKRAQFIEVLTTGPVRENGSLVGQTYSFNELLPSGHHAWRFATFLTRESCEQLAAEGREKEEIEDFLKRTFRAVVLSCTSSAPEPPAKPKAAKKARRAKVVSISEFEHKRKMIRAMARPTFNGPKLRPIEFDSQRRVA